MCIKSNNIEIMTGNETEESMKGSDFVSVSVDLFYCKCYCCGSYIDSPK